RNTTKHRRNGSVISANVVADSLAPCGSRLTTFVLKYPRMVHCEFLTHRAISRNSSSSRAIPNWKMVVSVFDDPAMPVEWGQNCKGMQSKKALPRSRQWACRLVWLTACYLSCGLSWVLGKLGAHKQLANRLLEPFAHITVVATATNWQNF